jgi:hypothetical protein
MRLSLLPVIGVVSIASGIALTAVPNSAQACKPWGGGGGGGGGHHRHGSNGGNPTWEFVPDATSDEIEQRTQEVDGPQFRPAPDQPPPDAWPPQPDGFRFPTPAEASPMIDERNALQDDVDFLQQMKQQIYNGKMILAETGDGDLYPVPVQSGVKALALGAALDADPGSDDSTKLAKLMVAQAAAKAAAQQSLDATIREAQAKIAAINIRLGYNRYRPLP